MSMATKACNLVGDTPDLRGRAGNSNVAASRVSQTLISLDEIQRPVKSDCPLLSAADCRDNRLLNKAYNLLRLKYLINKQDRRRTTIAIPAVMASRELSCSAAGFISMPGKPPPGKPSGG